MEQFKVLENNLDGYDLKSTGFNIKQMQFQSPATGAYKEGNGKFLECYLNKLIKLPKIFTKFNSLHMFLQISGLNYTVSDKIFFQGILQKKIGGHNTTGCFMKCIRGMFSSWRSRYFAISSEGICYAKKYSVTEKGFIDMLFFDRTVKIRYGKRVTGHPFGRVKLIVGLVINTSSRALTICCHDKLSTFIVLKVLHQSVSESPYVRSNPYDSFSPVRAKNHAKAFVNAEAYFRDLHSDFDSAQDEIFIRGWWISPEVYLLRPIERHPESRLDKVLLRAARRGVKIHIILFKEYKAAMPNDSSHAKKSLENLHKNIRIIRHPGKLSD